MSKITEFYTEKTRIFIYVPRWIAILILSALFPASISDFLYRFIGFSLIWYIIWALRNRKKK